MDSRVSCATAMDARHSATCCNCVSLSTTIEQRHMSKSKLLSPSHSLWLFSEHRLMDLRGPIVSRVKLTPFFSLSTSGWPSYVTTSEGSKPAASTTVVIRCFNTGKAAPASTRRLAREATVGFACVFGCGARKGRPPTDVSTPAALYMSTRSRARTWLAVFRGQLFSRLRVALAHGLPVTCVCICVSKQRRREVRNRIPMTYGAIVPQEVLVLERRVRIH